MCVSPGTGCGAPAWGWGVWAVGPGMSLWAGGDAWLLGLSGRGGEWLGCVCLPLSLLLHGGPFRVLDLGRVPLGGGGGRG